LDKGLCFLGPWYQNGKMKGIPTGFLIGILVSGVWAVEQVPEEKIFYSPELVKKAEAGDAEAQYELGVAYCLGQGVTRNLEEAVKWYAKSAEQGNANSQCNLGVHLYKGEGGPRDVQKAVKWISMSAEQGHAKAQLLLGRCYYKGDGVPQSDQEAIKWWKKSADQGNVEASMYLKSME